jgi:hypothetical protein
MKRRRTSDVEKSLIDLVGTPKLTVSRTVKQLNLFLKTPIRHTASPGLECWKIQSN